MNDQELQEMASQSIWEYVSCYIAEEKRIQEAVREFK